MLVVVGLFPLVMLQMKFLNPWLLNNLPLSPATMLANILSVFLISYLTMPLCIRLFRWWLYPEKDRSHVLSGLGTLVVLFVYMVEVALFWNF
jgi:antibiotic biosynthesis monooxygenase (ABM) superfamily enzyme